jgi:periplasmic copper chaperone A
MRIFLLLLTGLLSSCSNESGPPLFATDLELTAVMPGTSTSAAYLTLTNNSDALIRLTKVSSPQYGLIEIHESTVVDDIARMRLIDELEINPHQSVRLQRGGIHLMMMRPMANIQNVTLNLYDGELLLMSMRSTPAAAGN